MDSSEDLKETSWRTRPAWGLIVQVQYETTAGHKSFDQDLEDQLPVAACTLYQGSLRYLRHWFNNRDIQIREIGRYHTGK
jgi:hypothetical protein